MPLISSPSTQKHVLVADNLEENIQLYRIIFSKVQAFTVEYAMSGAEVIELCRKACETDNRYDLLVLDIAMPDLDGFDTLAYVREHHRGCYIHAIFLSAYAERDIMNQMRAKQVKAPVYQRTGSIAELDKIVADELLEAERIEAAGFVAEDEQAADEATPPE